MRHTLGSNQLASSPEDAELEASLRRGLVHKPGPAHPFALVP
jgi:hypothetical protein